MKYGEYIIKQYYPDIYKNFQELSDIDEGYYSYSLHIEHIFAVTKKNGSVVWSGSVYEAAYEKAPLGDFKTNFLSSMAKALYVSDTYSNMALNNVSNFPHLLPVTNLKTTSYAEIKDHAYGYNVFGLKDLITKPKETQETEPPTGDIKIKKDKELTMKKIENVDNVEIYTGYAAQNGYYDIGTNGGIPTTEEIRNVIRAQDFIIDYAYNFLKYVPEEFPVVTYKLTYYVPCKCKRTCIHTTHHSAEYDNDGNKIKDEWTEYKHKDGDVGYHGNSYHKSTDTYTVSIPRAAVYYKITDYKIYALETVSVSNQAGSAYYDGLSPINSVDAVISGEDNPTNIEKEALDKHIDYTDVNNLEFDNAGIGEGVFSSKAAAESWYNNNGFKFGDSKVGYPKVANDQLIINFNDDRGSLQLMDSTWVSKEHMNDQYVVVPDKPLAVPKYRMVEAEQQHIEIPYDLMNGNYSTTINAYYHLYAGTEDHAGYVLFSNAAKPGHIMPESVLLKNNNSVSFESQEPIHIMTPIISPFETTDSNKLPDLTEDEKAKMTENEIKEYERKQLQSGTQLVTEENCQQLRLDEEYTLSFDPFMHNLWLGYGYSGLIDNENYWSGRDGLETDNKFDKYVHYEMVDERICKCKNIANDELSIISAAEFHSFCNYIQEDMQEIIKETDYANYCKMRIVDYLIDNPDRTENNYGFYRDNHTGDIIGLHPLFDHNNSFGNYDKQCPKILQSELYQWLEHSNIKFNSVPTLKDFFYDQDKYNAFTNRACELGIFEKIKEKQNIFQKVAKQESKEIIKVSEKYFSKNLEYDKAIPFEIYEKPEKDWIKDELDRIGYIEQSLEMEQNIEKEMEMDR